MMKKFILAAAALLIGATALAGSPKTCRVAGTNGGSVVVDAYVTDSEKGKCVVTFSNDTYENVNVIYTVWAYDSMRQAVGVITDATKLVPPGEDSEEITFQCIPGVITSVKVTSISGTKCEE